MRLKEKKQVTEIVAVSIGPKAAQDVIRTAMAVGADRGIHIETNLRADQELQPLAVAKILKHIADVRLIWHLWFECFKCFFVRSIERKGRLSYCRKAIYR